MQSIRLILLAMFSFDLLTSSHAQKQNIICRMTAVKSFEDCSRECQQTATTKYYNPETNMCQIPIKCPSGTFFRVYQNKCVDISNLTTVGKLQTQRPEQYQQIRIVVVHGNFLMKTKQEMCYPGFMSSKNRVSTGKNTYDEYYCDVLIGQLPEKYPREFGEFFFWKCSLSEKLAFLKMYLDDNEANLYKTGSLQRQPYYYLKQITLLILLYAQIAFCISVILYHLELIVKCCQNVKKRLGFGDANQQ